MYDILHVLASSHPRRTESEPTDQPVRPGWAVDTANFGGMPAPVRRHVAADVKKLLLIVGGAAIRVAQHCVGGENLS